MRNAAIFILLIFLFPRLSVGKSLRFSNIEHPVADKARKVLSLAYKRLGIEAKFSKAPVKRSLIESNSGGLDGEAIRIKEALKHAPNLRLVPTPIIRGEFKLYSRKPERYQGAKSISGSTIATINGLLGVVYLPPVAKIFYTSKHTQVFSMLLAGRVDYGYLDSITGASLLSKPEWKGKVFMLEPAVKEVFGFHFLHKKHEALIPQVAKSLEKLLEENPELRRELGFKN